MASTGILLCLFILLHMAGNFLLYVSKNAFNTYASALNSTSLVYLAEFGLLALVALHILTAINLTIENKKARPVSYAKKQRLGAATYMSNHMFTSGMVILIFVVFHVHSFKFGAWDNTLQKYPDTLYDLVVLSFANLPYSIFYVVCVVFLGFHLHHAVKSAFITLGIAHKSTVKLLTCISFWYSLIIVVGFASFPIYFYLDSFLK